MDVATIEVPQEEAEIKYREYADSEVKSEYIKRIKSIYYHLKKGKQILDILDAFRIAGTRKKLPKLAMAKANKNDVRMEILQDRVEFQHLERYWFQAFLSLPRNLFRWLKMPTREDRYSIRLDAKVPIIPPDKWPKRSKQLREYYILWEVEEWKRIPRDPILLRRLTGNLFLVVDTWDLTEVERKVMETL